MHDFGFEDFGSSWSFCVQCNISISYQFPGTLRSRDRIFLFYNFCFGSICIIRFLVFFSMCSPKYVFFKYRKNTSVLIRKSCLEYHLLNDINAIILDIRGRYSSLQAGQESSPTPTESVDVTSAKYWNKCRQVSKVHAELRQTAVHAGLCTVLLHCVEEVK